MTVRPDLARNPGPEPDEDYVRGLLDSAISGSRPPLDLPAAALARGRRLRTRRRAGVATAVVAASVLAAVALPWALSGTGTVPDSNDLVATQPPAPAQTTAPRPAGFWDMPSRTMVSALTARLPGGRVLADAGPLDADTPEGGPGRGSISSTIAFSEGGDIRTGDVHLMLWPDSPRTALEGVGEASLDFTLGDAGGANDLLCPPDQESLVSCTQVTRPDGTIAGRRSVTQLGELKVLEFVLAAGDGVVHGATANTEDSTWGAGSEVTASRPPLDLAELEELVRDPVWTSYRP